MILKVLWLRILVSDLCKRDAWCSESLDESVKMYIVQ